MNVRELIELLKTKPPDARAVVWDGDNACYVEIEDVCTRAEYVRTNPYELPPANSVYFVGS